MVRYKDNRTYWHPVVVHIAGYEKCKNISICMYTYLAIMHMHNWMNLDNWTTLVYTYLSKGYLYYLLAIKQKQVVST
jgi:hypothetical protein